MLIWLVLIKIGGGFSAKGNFKKWYKQGFHGVLDYMLVNRRVAWNLSAEIDAIKQHKNNAIWRVFAAEEMLKWTDPFHRLNQKETTSPN